MITTELQRIVIKATIEAGIRTLDFYGADIDVQSKKDDSPFTQADLESNRIIVEYLSKTDYPILSEEIENSEYNVRKDWDLFWMVDPLDGTKEFIKKGTDYTINIALIQKAKPVFGSVYAPVRDILYLGYVGDKALKIEDASKFVSDDLDLILEKSIIIPEPREGVSFKVVASKSHMNAETTQFVENIKQKIGNVELCNYGSSLKLCMIAEGSADLYPRIGPTMEWDTAAGQAVLMAAGGLVLKYPEYSAMVYNKENLLNPFFVAYSGESAERMGVSSVE